MVVRGYNGLGDGFIKPKTVATTSRILAKTANLKRALYLKRRLVEED
jgi:hypothetical protein